jgi:hypothetical protein
MAEQIFGLELLEQRKKVQEECEKLQTLVDNEMKDSAFILCPDSKYVHIISHIF